MPLKKEILLFYVLIIVSAGVIIAADQPEPKKATPKKPGVKCCKINNQGIQKRTNSPLYYITEGIIRFKA